MTECEVERQLFNWARWVKEERKVYQSLWYPKNVLQSLVQNGVLIARSGAKNDGDDNPEAEKVDEIMKKLKGFKRDWFEAVFVRFMSPTKSQHEMATMIGYGRTAFLKQLSAGQGWVAGSLSQLEAA